MRFEIERPATYLISPGDALSEDFPVFKDQFILTIQLAVNADISIVQIREKQITTKQLFELAAAAVEITRNSTTKLLINSRADVALAACADGVHLPEDGVPVAAIRKAFPSLMTGCSVHSVQRGVVASKDGADFLLFGPVFDTGEKKGVGTSILSEVCAAVGETPVLAVGGVNASNVASVLDAGAVGFAAIRYLNDHGVLKALR